MAFKNLVDKSKDLAAKAREASTEAAHSLANSAGDVWDMSQEKASQAFEKLLSEINGLKPILIECGFILGDFNVTLSVPPDFHLTVEQTGRGSTTLQQILAEDSGRLSRLQRMVLTSMIKANDMAQVTRRYGYTFRKYDIDLTLPPRVTVHLVSEKSGG